MSESQVGPLPKGWHWSALRRVATCRDDLRAPVNAVERAQRPGDIPYWGANSVQGTIDVALVHKPVVLLGEDGAPFFETDRPVAFYIEEPIWPNNHIHVLVPKRDVSGRWLAHALNAVDYSLVITGSTRDKLTQGAMLSIPLAVPPHDEQCAIANFLDEQTSRIDTLIAKQDQLIATLRERRDAYLGQQFAAHGGQRVTSVRRVLRPLLRLAPLGLGVITAYRDGEVTLRSSRREDGYTFSDTEAGYQEIRPGDLVFHALDGFAGACGVSDSNGVGSPVYHVCEPTQGDDTAYLALLLRYLGTSGFLATQAPNVRQRSVDFRNWSTFAQVPLTLPTPDEQRAFVQKYAARRTRVDSLIAKTHEHIALAKERRAALITAAVTGQIDLRTAALTGVA